MIITMIMVDSDMLIEGMDFSAHQNDGRMDGRMEEDTKRRHRLDHRAVWLFNS